MHKKEIGIIGKGSIASKRIKILKKIGYKIIIYDPKFNFYKKNLKLILKKCETVFICSPLNTHDYFINLLVNNNKNIFVEKPLSINLKKISKILKKAKKKKITVVVGFNLRFRNIVKAIKKIITYKQLGKIFWCNLYMSSYLPRWRKNYNLQNSYTNSKKNGGVLLDSIHELNLSEYFFGETKLISSYLKNFNFLNIKSDEIAKVLLKNKETLISIHLDYINKKKFRRVEICGSKKFLYADLSKGELMINNKKIKIKKNNEYYDEIVDFFNCIKFNKNSINNAENTLRIHKIASEIKKKNA